MSNSHETDGTDEGLELDIGESENLFTPRWSECSGVFNEGVGLSSRENEEVHYRKHVVVGKEWDDEIALADYRSQAVQHLNDLDAERVIELCQAEDYAVVKYNIDSGELGIAHRDDGAIKTFFRPNDTSYVLRKLDAGIWGEPGIVDGFQIEAQPADFADDDQKFYLFERLQALALELPSQAHSVVVSFTEENPSADEVLLLLARLGEYRFVVFELQRRILTEAQNNVVFSLRKKIVSANASVEALERHRGSELTNAIKKGLEFAITKQDILWHQATALITDLEQFDCSLNERQSVGYANLELKILQIHRRMLNLDLTPYEYDLRKSDLYLRNHFYQLAVRFNYIETHIVSPEAFFWRSMGANIQVQPTIVYSSSKQTSGQPSNTLKSKVAKLDSKTVVSKLGGTMSNPHYQHDLNKLDEIWDFSTVISPETIFIVTGCNVAVELLDRPVAERLRDEIDKRGNPSTCRRAIIIGDLWWWKERQNQSNPVISIGSHNSNSLTPELASKGSKWEVPGGLCGCFVDDPLPKAALWGESAGQTRDSVEHFINHPEGLSSFLKLCWKPLSHAENPVSPHSNEPEPETSSDFSALLENYERESAASRQEGEIIRGIVVGISEHNVLIDIGYKSEGIVPREEFLDRKGNLSVKRGDEVDVLIKSLENQEGYAVLSRADVVRQLDTNGEQDFSFSAFLETYEKESAITKQEGEIVRGIVVGISDQHVLVDIGYKSEGIVAREEFVDHQGNLTVKRGDEVDVLIKSLENQDGYAVLSRGDAVPRQSWEKLRVGSLIQGKVVRLNGSGAFIEIDTYIEGFIPVEELTWFQTNPTPTAVLTVGQEIHAVVVYIDSGNHVLNLSIKELEDFTNFTACGCWACTLFD